MNSTYRIAVIGIGSIAETHAQAIQALDDATLVAGTCRTEEKGVRFAEEYDCNWYGDNAEMLDTEKPDVVTVCTPSGAHLEPTIQAAERGVHVLCEKPLEVTTERINRMRAAADDAGVALGGFFPWRYKPLVRKLQEAAAAGRFGTLSLGTVSVPWWRTDEYYSPDRWQGTKALDGGGALMNQSIHGIDALQWVIGSATPDLDRSENPVAEVFAYTTTRGHDPELLEVEDTAVAVLRFENGALGQILGATSAHPGTAPLLRIGGRDGLTEISDQRLTAWSFREEHALDATLHRRFGGESDGHGSDSDFGDPQSTSYAPAMRNISDFLRALESEEPFLVDGTESRKAVEIVEAIYESAATSKPVLLAE